ncbi:papain-like cysteine protease family protein [Actinokineospora auranticolor]|uniref:Papain like cysteine protease AvrRpt2 n=1 Tax=Actinokineospora auranticolor TaxID=155976 RepID=A0A2S6H165_9PSEU|nr:papain-like cysteine protease family protein [Actinokineospora auranticolor]PPK71157.1 papain like cysteine protease AvrRpt2 [Actinokineospora auranticolor]
MDRTSIRRCLPGVVAVAAALGAVVVMPSADAATGDPAALPHGLIKTVDHYQVKEVTPVRAPLDAAPLAAKKLNFTEQVQQQDQWCWAATGSSIERTLGATVSQAAFCAAGKGGSGGYCRNEGAEIPEIVRAFQGTGFNAQDAGGAISFASVQKQIDSGIPHLTGIYWTSGGGHANVIYGYDATNKSIMVGDPWPSYQRYQTWAYTQYRSNARFRWNDTVVNIAKR